VHLEQERRVVAPEQRADPLPRNAAAPGCQVEVEADRIQLGLRGAVPPRAEVVVQVEQHGPVEDRLDQLERVRVAE
jgi:hypothetical protein